jgi:hypothetical protein
MDRREKLSAATDQSLFAKPVEISHSIESVLHQAIGDADVVPGVVIHKELGVTDKVETRPQGLNAFRKLRSSEQSIIGPASSAIQSEQKSTRKGHRRTTPGQSNWTFSQPEN